MNPAAPTARASFTRADFERQAETLEAAATTMLQRHRAADTGPTEPDPDTWATRRIERLEHDAPQIRDWLATHPEDRRGAKGTLRKRTARGRNKSYCTPETTAVRHVAFIAQSSVIDRILAHLRNRAARESHCGPRSPPSTRALASRGPPRAPRPSADAPPVN